MKTRAFVPVLVALVVLPSVAGLVAPTEGIDDTTTVAPRVGAGAVFAQQSEGASGSGAEERSAATTDPGNYTRLYIDAERPHLQLKPGESGEFTVTVENGEEAAVGLDPHLYVPPVGGPVLEESWVSIDGPSRLEAGERAEYTVSIDVPDDAEIGHYRGQVAFTDELVTYPGRPARPVHAEHVRVEVWKEPVVKIHSRTYVRTQVEAGDSVSREIVVENTGDRPVPLNPELTADRGRCHGDCPDRFDPSWLDVDAPNQVDPGETATVTVTIAPPGGTDPGRCSTELDLGLKDPNRDDRNTYWQTVNLNLEVWSQPDEPVETSFEVSEATEDVTVTLNPRSSRYHADGSGDPVGFDVTFVDPSGDLVEPERVRVTARGFVDMSGDARRPPVEGVVVRDGGEEFVYRVEDPDAGEWTMRVMPENTIGFGYEITRNEAGA